MANMFIEGAEGGVKVVESNMRRLENVMHKELRTVYDISTLEHYLKLEMVPQRLRWELDIHEGDESQSTKQFWSNFFNQCGLKLLETLIGRKRERLMQLNEEVKQIEILLEQHKEDETYKRLSDQLRKKLEKEDENIRQRKQRKLKRDSWEYKNNQIYKWQIKDHNRPQYHGREMGDMERSNLTRQGEYGPNRTNTGNTKVHRNQDQGNPQNVGDHEFQQQKQRIPQEPFLGYRDSPFHMRGRNPKWREHQLPLGPPRREEWRPNRVQQQGDPIQQKPQRWQKEEDTQVPAWKQQQMRGRGNPGLSQTNNREPLPVGENTPKEDKQRGAIQKKMGPMERKKRKLVEDGEEGEE